MYPQGSGPCTKQILHTTVQVSNLVLIKKEPLVVLWIFPQCDETPARLWYLSENLMDWLSLPIFILNEAKHSYYCEGNLLCFFTLVKSCHTSFLLVSWHGRLIIYHPKPVSSPFWTIKIPPSSSDFKIEMSSRKQCTLLLHIDDTELETSHRL